MRHESLTPMPGRKHPKSGDTFALFLTAAILGAVVFPVAGVWLGFAWKAFRWGAGW